MAKVIKFYVPQRHKPRPKWVPPSQRGKVIETVRVRRNA
jgi:hypothetical protein